MQILAFEGELFEICFLILFINFHDLRSSCIFGFRPVFLLSVCRANEAKTHHSGSHTSTINYLTPSLIVLRRLAITLPWKPGLLDVIKSFFSA